MLKNIVTMKTVKSYSPFEFMHDQYIAEIYRPVVIFLLLIVWVYFHSLLQSTPQTRYW